jgi:uncharacterized cupin superfamily protein
MPRIDLSRAVTRGSTVYPEPFAATTKGREKTALGDLVGLTQFGVNLTRLKPGAASALRHWHDNEDEFVYVLEGEVVLIEDGGATLLRPGDAAGFRASVAVGHQFVNRSAGDAVFLEIGARAANERAHYPDIDLSYVREDGKGRFFHKSGEPYEGRG